MFALWADEHTECWIIITAAWLILFHLVLLWEYSLDPSSSTGKILLCGCLQQNFVCCHYLIIRATVGPWCFMTGWQRPLLDILGTEQMLKFHAETVPLSFLLTSLSPPVCLFLCPLHLYCLLPSWFLAQNSRACRYWPARPAQTGSTHPFPWTSWRKKWTVAWPMTTSSSERSLTYDTLELTSTDNTLITHVYTQNNGKQSTLYLCRVLLTKKKVVVHTKL